MGTQYASAGAASASLPHRARAQAFCADSGPGCGRTSIWQKGAYLDRGRFRNHGKGYRGRCRRYFHGPGGHVEGCAYQARPVGCFLDRGEMPHRDSVERAAEIGPPIPVGSRIKRRMVLAWGLWDWGSSAYSAVITSFVFGPY